MVIYSYVSYAETVGDITITRKEAVDVIDQYFLLIEGGTKNATK